MNSSALLLVAMVAVGSFPARRAQAAACCSGNAVAPSIITGDNRAQLGASISHGSVIGDAPASGLPVFRSARDSEQSQTLRLDGAMLLSDRWQLGASLPVIRRSRQIGSRFESAQGPGDLSFDIGYEALPEWSYSRWRPRGFLFTRLTLPTGRSIHDSETGWAVDSRGRGQWAAALGGILLKTWGAWDASLLIEGHRLFGRKFGDLDVGGSWGTSAALGLGFSPGGGDLRVGAALAPAYDTGFETNLGQSSYQLAWTAALQLGYVLGDTQSLSAVYSDQTLFGPARNVALQRSVAVAFQQRWER